MQGLPNHPIIFIERIIRLFEVFSISLTNIALIPLWWDLALLIDHRFPVKLSTKSQYQSRKNMKNNQPWLITKRVKIYVETLMRRQAAAKCTMRIKITISNTLVNHHFLNPLHKDSRIQKEEIKSTLLYSRRHEFFRYKGLNSTTTTVYCSFSKKIKTKTRSFTSS